MAGDESTEESWVDQTTGWVSDTATDAANWTAETATDAADWTAETATDAADWTAETVSDDGNWWWDGSDWQPVLSDQQQVAVAQTGVAEAAEYAMSEIPEIQVNRERILQDLEHEKSGLIAGLQAAHAESTDLQSSFPDVDRERLADVGHTLAALSEKAANAGFRAGDDDFFNYAQVAFYQARDDAEWASRRAEHGSQQSDQLHAALEEIPPLVEHALATVQGIYLAFDAEHQPPDPASPPSYL